MQELQLKVAGVHTQANHMSEVPDGALSTAVNTVLDKESLLEPRRGFKRYGQSNEETEPVRRLFTYEDTLISHVGDELSRDDGAGTFTEYAGTFEEPASGFRLRDAEADGLLYVTTAAGIMKLDQIAGTWRAAGTPPPLDGVVSLTGSSGFLADDSTVAYRATLHYVDAKTKEIVSAPSGRVVAANASGGSRDTSLQWYLPDGMTTEYSIRVYRSAATADLLDEPSDELQLVAQTQLTSTNISDGYVTIADATPDSLRGATLYTSPSQEDIVNQNDEPPFAHDITVFKNHMFYANVRSKHRLSTTLIGAGPGSLTWVEDNGTTTNGSAIVTGLADTADLHVGMKAKAAAGIPSTARILSIDSGTQVTLTVNATATGARDIEFQDIIEIAGTEYFAATATSLVDHEFEAIIDDTPATNIELTALSLVFAVNQDPTNTTVYGFYVSGFEDIPGSVEFVERGIGGSSFTAVSTSGDSFNPPLVDEKTSSNDAKSNGVMISKPQQSEAVPLKNRLPVGSTPIRRIIALRDAAFALSDRIYRITGTSVSDFSVEEEGTTRLIGPETAVVFNDAIYCMSDQGVVRVTTGGVQVVSRAIEDDLQRVSSDLFPSFENIAWAVPYESSRRYVLFVPDEEDDQVPTKAWVFNAFTNSWTGPWPMSRTAGCVSTADDKMYLGDDEAAIFQERKSFSRSDYADEEFAVTVVSSDGAEVTLASTADIEEGYLLIQDFREALVLEVIDGTTVEVDTEVTWEAGAATAYQPIETSVRWVPATAGNPALMKHWQEGSFIFRDADFAELDVTFESNFVPLPESVALTARDLQGAWGAAPFGLIPWGVPQRGEQILRTYVPRDRRRAHWLVVGLEASSVFSSYKLAGLSLMFEPMSQRFRQR